jgi:hypothetical protein
MKCPEQKLIRDCQGWGLGIRGNHMMAKGYWTPFGGIQIKLVVIMHV